MTDILESNPQLHTQPSPIGPREAKLPTSLDRPARSGPAERLPNVVVAAELVMNIAEGCALSDRPLRDDELKEYVGKNSRSVNEAIKAALWMGLVESVAQGYVAPPPVRSEFPAGKERKALLFLQRLQRKKSFVQFATFLDYNNSPSDASEKVRVLYQIDVPADVVLHLFGGWGRSAGIFEGNNQSLRLKPEYRASDLPTEYLKGLKDALENDMKARVFVNRKLTEETFRSLPDAGWTVRFTPFGVSGPMRATRSKMQANS